MSRIRLANTIFKFISMKIPTSLSCLCVHVSAAVARRGPGGRRSGQSSTAPAGERLSTIVRALLTIERPHCSFQASATVWRASLIGSKMRSVGTRRQCKTASVPTSCSARPSIVDGEAMGAAAATVMPWLQATLYRCPERECSKRVTSSEAGQGLVGIMKHCDTCCLGSIARL